MNLSGGLFDYFVVFWGGVLVSFSPCVYPIMPVTASFIAGVNTRGTKMMGFIISLVYVLGLAVTYSAMAIFAALSGKVFGQFQNNPIILLIAANALIFFAIAMFDVIALPAIGVNVQNKIRPRNLWGVFLFGVASGLIV